MKMKKYIKNSGTIKIVLKRNFIAQMSILEILEIVIDQKMQKKVFYSINSSSTFAEKKRNEKPKSELKIIIKIRGKINEI